MILEFSISVIFQTKSILKEACNLKSVIVTVSLALGYVLTWSSLIFFFLNKELERTRRVLNVMCMFSYDEGINFQCANL